MDSLGAGADAAPAPGAAQDYFSQTASFQKALIERALQDSEGNLSRAASLLGLSRHALRHQMNKLGLSLR
ncbi:MAG: helix-turn-helix domain-containing protein [Pollutimonas bauzanensis]